MLGIGRTAKEKQIKSKEDASAPNGSEVHVFRKPKLGLALGAGVARGWSHIGVIRRLEEEGIPIDVIAGTSIGAVVGGGFASGKLAEIEDWATSLGKKSFFRFLDLKIGGSGLFGSDKLNELMKERFGNHMFSDLKIPFTAVACELKTGHEVWLREGNVSDAIRASFALPGIFEPRRVDGQWLVDGALVNPVPTSVCRAEGCDVIVAVNLSEDIYGSERAKREGALETAEFGVYAESERAAAIASKSKSPRSRLFGHKKNAPSMFANLVASINIMQNRLSRSRLAGDPPDVTINPRCGHIGLMEFHRTAELVEVGRNAAELCLPQIKDALAIAAHRMNS
ncbi:MAG: patatin-like phospholipase family protein [Kordiimonadaceae bacterium]|nr:patatin-like phospholipase family protein [Kordiimonadaceae bacterium]